MKFITLLLSTAVALNLQPEVDCGDGWFDEDKMACCDFNDDWEIECGEAPVSGGEDDWSLGDLSGEGDWSLGDLSGEGMEDPGAADIYVEFDQLGD